MRSSRALVCALAALLACKPGGGDPPTTSATGTTATVDGTTAFTTDPTTGAPPTSTSTGVPTTTTANSETGVETGPAGACDLRWELHDPETTGIDGIAVDSQGHLRGQTYTAAAEAAILDIDPSGAIVDRLTLEAGLYKIYLGGLDLDDAMYVALRDQSGDMPRERLRKYAAGGAQAWEVDLGSESDSMQNGPAVAADGTTVIAGDDVIVRHDAAGALVWSLPNDDHIQVPRLNAAGVAVATKGGDREVRVLEPDGSQRWSAVLDGAGFGVDGVALDDAGEVLAARITGLLVRFAADGAPRWTRDMQTYGIHIFADLAMNAAGDAVLIGRREGSTRVVRLDAAGDPLFVCDSEQHGVLHVALDDAGVVYLAGHTSSGLETWAAALDPT